MDNTKNNDFELSDNLREWCNQIPARHLVVFEDYDTTLLRNKQPELDLNNDYDEDDEEEMGMIQLKKIAFSQSIIGMGASPELMNINKNFKLWTIYTKVPFTHKLISILTQLPGIESLDFFTPYRARVGIGPLFKDREVLFSIKQNIENFSKSTQLPQISGQKIENIL